MAVQGLHGQAITGTVVSGVVPTEKIGMLNVRCIIGAALLGLSVATAPALAQGIAVGEDGWTVVTPSPDTQMIYVSSSSGDDNNDGLSEHTPKRTLAAGYALLRNGHPDWLLLKSGDTWNEAFPFWNRSGRNENERMVVRSYGEGPRPRLQTGVHSAVHINPGRNAQGINNLVFMDLHLTAHGNSGTSSATAFVLFNTVRNVRIENCYTERYRVNMIFQTIEPGMRLSNIEVRRNIIVDALATNHAHAQGIFADGVSGLVMEENVFDLNGWSAFHPTANIFRHNVYIQTNIDGEAGCTDVVAIGNITARASASGLMMRTGGICEDNLFIQNPIGLQFGQTGGPTSTGSVRNNVFLDSRDISNTTKRGLGMNISSTDGAVVSGNVLAHQRSGTDNVQAIGVDGTYRNLTISDNIVYDWNMTGGWTGRALGLFGTAQSNISIANNMFMQPNGGYLACHYAALTGAFRYSGNQYFSPNGGAHQFFQGVTYNQWVQQSNEQDSRWGLPALSEPTRGIEAYMASMGQTATVQAFMVEARQQSKNYWRPEFTARHVNQWVRDGFAMTGPACYADLDGDGQITIFDVVMFIDLFTAGDLHADANGDGTLNILDFIAFQELMQQGCP